MVAPSIPVLTELGDSHNAHNTQGQPSPSLCINRDKNQYADAQIDQSDQSDRPQPDDNDTLDQPTPRTPPSHESQSQAERESQSETQPTCLEDRVLDLESKLATLSRLLTQSMKRDSPLGVSPPSVPRTLHDMMIPDSPSLATSVPHLESPHPTKLRRRLSKVLLGESDSNINLLNCPGLPIDSDSQDDTCTLETSINKAIAEPEPKSAKQKWMDYLESFQESTPNVEVQMEEFVRVPSQLEALLTFGFLICIDSYLYILTMLPIKFLWSITLLLRSFLNKNGGYAFHRRHFYNGIQVSIIYFVYRFILIPISIGQLYHWIRGQAMLKLYVLIAIVEVFDRLMCSMGQDCLDSMYWNTTRRPRSTRMLVSVTVVVVYVVCHTLILFVHVATLNVAINSADHALLTLLISGNFAEIKSTVFKKYNRPNLFKITASDICERFKLALFLTLVLMLNLCQGGMDWRMTTDYLRMFGIVWMAELLADWIKHSFITKFNFIPSKVYPEYALLLAGDVTGIGHEGVNLDRSHAVVKRIGFAQLPLVCVMLRLVTEAVRYYAALHEGNNQYLILTLLTCAVWGSLFGIKLLLGSYLQRVCIAKLETAPELVRTPKKKKHL